MTQDRDQGGDEDQDGELVWHYTDTGSLLGILNSRSLWLTDLRYLNDRRELLEGEDVVRRTFEESAHLQPSAEIRTVKDLWLMLTLGRPTEIEQTTEGPYVASFCAKPDLLSQWRAYGKFGYSIGFRRSDLGCLTGASLVPVEYQTSDYKIPTEEIPFVSKGWQALTSGGMQHTVPPEVLARYKHTAFKEEDEWRLVAAAAAGGRRYRTGLLGVTPYTVVEFPATSIDTIWIGPSSNDSADEALRQAALRQLCRDLLRTDVTVLSSAIPYRV